MSEYRDVPDELVPEGVVRIGTDFEYIQPGLEGEPDIEVVEPCSFCESVEPENEYWPERDKWYCWVHSPNFIRAMLGDEDE